MIDNGLVVDFKTGSNTKKIPEPFAPFVRKPFWYGFYNIAPITHYFKVMDIIIFLKAIGNLLFAAILLLAVAFSSAFSVLTYMFRGSRPSVSGIKSLVRRKYSSR
jgi:hypothetical protein